MIRRYGEPPESARRYTRRPGVYAILYREGQVLLTYQSEPAPEVQLPGGGIDKGENPIAALHREAFEETGWHIAIERRFGTFRRFTHMPEYGLWAEKVCTIYIARPIMRISGPSEPGHTALWLPFDLALDALGNPGDHAMLQKFIQEH
jgi:8-oxo-dGTP diphosphatase